MTFRHIVLVIYDTVSKRWGALGLSRKTNLMFKPLEYESLSQLTTDFKRSFAAWNHQVVKVISCLSSSMLYTSIFRDAQECGVNHVPL